MLRILLNENIKEGINSLGESIEFLPKFHSYLRYLLTKIPLEKSPILIYNMAKVGSSTIKTSLEKIFQSRPIYRFHLATEWGEKIWTEKLKCMRSPTVFSWNKYLISNVGDGEKIENNKWKIISLTREPISRNISSYFFHMIYNNNPELIEKYNNNKLDLNYFIKYFKYNYPHEYPLKWFYKEFLYTTGFDVFSRNFEKSKGYSIYNLNNFDLLILKLEKLNEIAEKSMKEFLDIKNFKLIKSNVANERKYHNIYRDFKKEIRFSDDFLNSMYNSNFSKHFYTEIERQNFIEKWKE